MKHLKQWQVKVIRVENDRPEVMYNYKTKQEVTSREQPLGSDLII